jgi:hypothetical protein
MLRESIVVAVLVAVCVSRSSDGRWQFILDRMRSFGGGCGFVPLSVRAWPSVSVI